MLTDIGVKNLYVTKRREFKDEGGLVLDVTPNGVKTWRFRFYANGKDCKLMLGRYPEISLKEARTLRDNARLKRARGINLSNELCASTTFVEAYTSWMVNRIECVKSAKYTYGLKLRAKPLIEGFGDKLLKDVTPPDVLAVVRKIEARGSTYMAQRVKGVASLVFDYAIACGAVDINPAASLKRALKPHAYHNYPCITEPDKVGKLMRDIAAIENVEMRDMLYLHAITFVRPANIRLMEWAEVDLLNSVWKIAGDKMKSRELFWVPLAAQAVEILREMQGITGRGKYVFPSPLCWDGAKVLSDATEVQPLRRMGYGKDIFTPHGFRGMASTLLYENGFEPNVIEKQLAHTVGSSVVRAYNHAEYMEKRTAMMQWYADYLDSLRDGKDKPPIN